MASRPPFPSEEDEQQGGQEQEDEDEEQVGQEQGDQEQGGQGLQEIVWDADGVALTSTFKTQIGSLARLLVPINYSTWHHVPFHYKETLFNTLQETWDLPPHRAKWVLKIAALRWKNYKFILRRDYLDTNNTIAAQKADKPPRVRQEEWEGFVDLEATQEKQDMRTTGRDHRELMVTPQTTGRRGAAAIAEGLRKDDPTTSRTDVWLACHTRKDGSTPTQQSRELVDQVRARMQQDPQSRIRDLDHDPVAEVFGTDGRGWTRGVGAVSKTTLTAAGTYRDQLIAQKTSRKKKDANAAGPSHSTQSHATFQPSFEATPAVRTGERVLKDIANNIAAIGDVLDAAPGHKGLLNIRLRIVGLPLTPMFEGSGLLGTRAPGEVVKWPSYFVDYV